MIASTSRIYIYCRASDNERSRKSPENQELACRQVAEHLEGQVAGVFCDPDRSAWKTRFAEREAAQALLEVICPGDKLVVWKLDRIARLIDDMADTVHYLVKQRGIKVYATDLGGANGVQIDSAADRAHIHMLGLMAEYESGLRSERIKAGIERAKKVDPRLAHPNPVYGYRKTRNADGDVVLVPDPIDQYWCYRLYEHKQEGGDLKQFWQELLLAKQVKTPEGKLWSYDRALRVARYMTKLIAAGKTL
jgi:DNA invertase Pin-like site-specific DNA recombinase